MVSKKSQVCFFDLVLSYKKEDPIKREGEILNNQKLLGISNLRDLHYYKTALIFLRDSSLIFSPSVSKKNFSSEIEMLITSEIFYYRFSNIEIKLA